MIKGTWADVEEKYNTEEKCEHLFLTKLWPNGIECTKCKHCNQITDDIHTTNRKMFVEFKCSFCGKKIKKQTNCIFTNSPLPFRTWLKAIYRIAIKQKSTASLQMEEEVGIYQSDAWKLFLRISQLAKQDTILLKGEVEMDEWYYNGDPKYKHNYQQSIYGSDKGIVGESIPIFGMVERELTDEPSNEKSKLVLQLLDVKGKRSVAAKDIKPFIDKFVLNSPDVVVYTDAAKIYKTAGVLGGRMHKIIPHNVTKGSKIRHDELFVQGDTYTCNVEGAFGQLSKYLTGTHNKVSRNYIQRYIDLFCFRWNNRHLDTETKIYNLLDNLNKTFYGGIDYLKSNEEPDGKSKEERIFIKKHPQIIKYLNEVPYQWIGDRNLFLWFYQCSLEEECAENHMCEYSEHPYDYTESFQNCLNEFKRKKQLNKLGKWAKNILSEYEEISQILDIKKRKKQLELRIKIGLNTDKEREEISRIRRDRQKKYSKTYYEKNKKNRCPDE